LSVPDDERPPTWVFARESTTIRVRRLPGLRLHIESSENNERTFTFDDLNQLSAFHSEFERHLVATGWSLVEFGPERRSGRDRRSAPRWTLDRRRSWLKPTSPATND
jgi:hypothetical protein